MVERKSQRAEGRGREKRFATKENCTHQTITSRGKIYDMRNTAPEKITGFSKKRERVQGINCAPRHVDRADLDRAQRAVNGCNEFVHLRCGAGNLVRRCEKSCEKKLRATFSQRVTRSTHIQSLSDLRFLAAVAAVPELRAPRHRPLNAIRWRAQVTGCCRASRRRRFGSIPDNLNCTRSAVGEMEGIGTNQMWGFTPSLDAQCTGAAMSRSSSSASSASSSSARQWQPPSDPAAPLNILVVGTGDIRHVLHTVCAARGHCARKLNVRVIADGGISAGIKFISMYFGLFVLCSCLMRTLMLLRFLHTQFTTSLYVYNSSPSLSLSGPLSSSSTTHQFFVFDDTIECLARHLLLMTVALDGDLNIPERAQLVLELHGNALLRSKTRTYLADKAGELLRALAAADRAAASALVSASASASSTSTSTSTSSSTSSSASSSSSASASSSTASALAAFDLSHLKHKERDALEDVLRFWRAAKPADFDMGKLRELRCRHHFKVMHAAARCQSVSQSASEPSDMQSDGHAIQ